MVEDPSYIPTGEYWRIQEVYVDWVQSNYGENLSGGIGGDEKWKKRWNTLAVKLARRYDAPSRRVSWQFVYMLAAELTGVWQH